MNRKLLRNATVLSWDEASRSIQVLNHSSILIVGDRIAAITAEDERDEAETTGDTEVVDMTGKILSPGFVNTHCHMWQTAFRSMAPDVFIAQYFIWLSQMGQATTSFSPSDIYTSSLEGYLEGLNAGVTSFVDHASVNWRQDIIVPGWDAAAASGARVWWCYDLNSLKPDEMSIEEQVKTLQNLESKSRATDSTIAMGLAFDGFHLSTEANVEDMKRVSR